MARLQPMTSRPSALGLAITFALGIGASDHPKAAAEVRAAADGTGSRVVVNGKTFTITNGKLSGTNQFHSFDRFDLKSTESAHFQAPGHVKNILGRVVGASPSMIDGLIRLSGANANLYLINPTGISFGPNARLALPGSFHASTASAVRLGEGWFRASGTNSYAGLGGAPNAFAFLHNTPGSIINAGQLQVNGGESITLMGGSVINTGTLTANGGTVTLLATNGTKLVEVGANHQLLSLALPAADQQTLSTGLQPLTHVSLPALLTGGSIRHASTLEVASDGTVRLRGSGAVVPSGPGAVMASGRLDASGQGNGQEVGGLIRVLGQVVALNNATIDVSGTKGGGTARIGGDFKGQGSLPAAQRTTVDGSSTIRADAIERGQGGNVVVWADGGTQFLGEVSAKGGQTSGNGGFVEISGKSSLRYDGQVNTSAPGGATGILLLDPANIQIVRGSVATNDGLLEPKKQILAAESPDTMVISEDKIEQESKNNALYLQARQGITIANLQPQGTVPNGNLSNGTLDLTKGISFIAGAKGFQMDASNTIKITELSQGLTIKSPNGPVSLGSIETNAGNVNIEGSQIVQRAERIISTNQGNLKAKSLKSMILGKIQTNNINDSGKEDEFIINKFGEHGNVSLISENGDVISTSINTSNTKTDKNEGSRAGNISVGANNGVFRVTGTIGKENNDIYISIDTSGRRSVVVPPETPETPESFDSSGIGSVKINARSASDFFLAGAHVEPIPNTQGENFIVNINSRNSFESDSRISGSFGAVIGNSFNATLESVITNTGTTNSTLFTLSISKFPTNPGENKTNPTNPGGNKTTKLPKTTTNQNGQNISNTEQLDQTASTTQCAEGGEKECVDPFNEELSPILDVSAIQK